MAEGKAIPTIISGVTVVLFYAVSFWRIVKPNPGNRVIECGSMTLMLFVAMLVAFKLPNIPDWVMPSLGLLVLLLGLLTIFFLLQQAWRALHRRKSN